MTGRNRPAARPFDTLWSWNGSRRGRQATRSSVLSSWRWSTKFHPSSCVDSRVYMRWSRSILSPSSRTCGEWASTWTRAPRSSWAGGREWAATSPSTTARSCALPRATRLSTGRRRCGRRSTTSCATTWSRWTATAASSKRTCWSLASSLVRSGKRQEAVRVGGPEEAEGVLVGRQPARLRPVHVGREQAARDLDLFAEDPRRKPAVLQEPRLLETGQCAAAVILHAPERGRPAPVPQVDEQVVGARVAVEGDPHRTAVQDPVATVPPVQGNVRVRADQDGGAELLAQLLDRLIRQVPVQALAVVAGGAGGDEHARRGGRLQPGAVRAPPQRGEPDRGPPAPGRPGGRPPEGVAEPLARQSRITVNPHSHQVVVVPEDQRRPKVVQAFQDRHVVGPAVHHVAVDHHQVGRLPLQIGQARLERQEVAVDIGEDRDPHGSRTFRGRRNMPAVTRPAPSRPLPP